MNTGSKFAFPVSYADSRSGIGSVTVVAEEGPPLSVHQWTEADGQDNKHIAIELEDIIKSVERDRGLSDSEVMRLCLHLADARKLTHNLITRLAESGDPVAKRLHEYMNDSMEIVRALENAPIATCNLHLTSMDYASFDLTWTGNASFDLTWTGRTNTHFKNRLEMNGEKWLVPLAEATKNPTTFSMERLRCKDEVMVILRIIRKYAETIGLLLKMQDNNDILRGIDYKSFLDPYNAPNPIVPLALANCRIYRVSDGEIKLDVDGPLINIRTTEKNLTTELFNLASVAFKQNLLIKFIDPGRILAGHNLKNIFGRNLHEVVSPPPPPPPTPQVSASFQAPQVTQIAPNSVQFSLPLQVSVSLGQPILEIR